MIKIERGKTTTSVEIKGSAATLTAEFCGGFQSTIKSIAESDTVAAAAMFKCMAACMADVAEELVEEFNIAIEDLNDDLEDENDDLESFKSKCSDHRTLKKFLESLTPTEMLKLIDIIDKFKEFAEEDE